MNGIMRENIIKNEYIRGSIVVASFMEKMRKDGLRALE